uniref:Pantetheine-phosphate adenylyltransferase n=1 Tax=Strigomonas galati TaxID=1003336 RepID=T1YTH6_9TRYP|nr:pantetheine-phosphate adenylyltransferase [Strigomonas galati]
MRRFLSLSTVAAKETNAKALVDYLKAETDTTATSDIFLSVHDGMRHTFLEHATSLYNAALEYNPLVTVDVIPVVSPPAAGSDPATGAGHQLLDRAYLEASKGFTPCYDYVAVGGTFDHLHSGHKLLLTTAVLHTLRKLRVGVTGDALLQKKKFAEYLQSNEVRKKAVRDFLQHIRQDVELEIETIEDVSGGTDTIPDVKAIALSPETEKSLDIINDLRKKNGNLPPLAGIRIPFVSSSSGEVISSTRLRQGMTK